MAQIVLSAQTRTKTGSSVARRLRRTGQFPAVIYGRTGNTVMIDVNVKEFVSSAKNISRSTILTIAVKDGKSYEVFVKDVQQNIINAMVLHADFYEVEADVALRAKVKIHIHGNPIGVRDGGILELPVHEVEVECLPKYLPPRIDVDIADLKVNQSIHIRDLNLGENVRVLSGSDQVIALVKFAKAEAATAAAETEATATPAPEAKS
ncbi:50S ribosomal protein L25 [Spirochaetia bacterium]|nr:50S ribosomal protein L25 [Spirochaetia bacterium]GHU33603.1 50S ribosomal protein L25 [Spirochaetia bacterium]